MKIVFISQPYFSQLAMREHAYRQGMSDALPNLPVIYIREIDTMVILADNGTCVTKFPEKFRRPDDDEYPSPVSFHDIVNWLMEPERKWTEY